MSLKLVVESARDDGLAWSFFEDGENVREMCLDSIPGRMVTFFSKHDVPQCERALKLFVCFVARRSLLAWFMYCDNIAPYGMIDTAINSILTGSNIVHHSPKPVIPTKNGIEIADCRRVDTGAASSSVFLAIRCLESCDVFDAITAISHAHIAFEVSPVSRSSADFETWLVEIAYTVSKQLRELSIDEMYSHCDYYLSQSLQLLRKSEGWKVLVRKER